MEELHQRVVAHEHRHDPLVEDARVERADARTEERREAQHRDGHVRIAAREGGRVLLGLQLVAHPGERGVGLERPVLREEARVPAAGAVDRGEGADHDVLDAGGRGRGQDRQRADGFELVGVGRVAPRGWSGTPGERGSSTSSLRRMSRRC